MYVVSDTNSFHTLTFDRLPIPLVCVPDNLHEQGRLIRLDGYVNYVSQATAQSKGLYRTQNNQVYIGVDSTTVLDPNGVGRDSVRLRSNRAYTHGLIIADFAHVPGSNCGSWPAL